MLPRRALLATATLAVFVTSAPQPWASPHGWTRVLGIVEVPRAFGLSPDGARSPLDAPLVLRRQPAENSPVAVTITTADSIDSAEYGYEESGARVFGRSESWSLIRTIDGATGWLAPNDAGAFHSLESLLAEGLTYLTDSWDGGLRQTPNASASRPVKRSKATGDEPAVRVRGFRRYGDGLWVSVEVLSHSPCASSADPTVVARGWIPAHDAKGAPTVWFYSRGC